MSLERIIFAPLDDGIEDDISGWDKQTVNYVIKNKSKIERMIRGYARSYRKNKLSSMDIEDIYEDILMYLHSHSDYDIGKAIDRSSSGGIVSLEGYVGICTKYCVMRYCHDLASHESGIVSEYSATNDEDKELDIFNTIPDSSSEITLDNFIYNIEEICRSCEPLRYRFGVDIYLMFYIKLLLGSEANDKYYRILDVLGIEKKDLSKVDKSAEDALILSIAKAVSMVSTEYAIEVIEGYVFSSDMVKNAILNI